MRTRDQTSRALTLRCGHRLAFLLTLFLVVATSSCTTGPPQEPTQPPTTGPSPSASVNPSATPSPGGNSPSSASPSEKWIDAEQAVVRFWRVVDRLSADPNSRLEDLTTVSRGSAAAQWRQNINDYRFQRVKQTGNVLVINPSATRSAVVGQYEVTACIDVSKVNLIDRHGKSVVVVNRPPRVNYRYKVQKDAAMWFVTEEKAVGTC